MHAPRHADKWGISCKTTPPWGRFLRWFNRDFKVIRLHLIIETDLYRWFHNYLIAYHLSGSRTKRTAYTPLGAHTVQDNQPFNCIQTPTAPQHFLTPRSNTNNARGVLRNTSCCACKTSYFARAMLATTSVLERGMLGRWKWAREQVIVLWLRWCNRLIDI
jgi:hypothetical protein